MATSRTPRIAPSIAAQGRVILIHTRRSSDRQVDDRQLDHLRATATRFLGGVVIEEVREQISASATDNADRPDLQRIFELARAGRFNTYLVDDVDRIGRIPSELHATRRLMTELGVTIYFARLGVETLMPDGRKNVGAGHLFAGKAESAEDETDSLRYRTIGGIAAARAKKNPLDPSAAAWGRGHLPNGGKLSPAELLQAVRTGELPSGRDFRKADVYRRALKLVAKGNTRREIATLTGLARATIDKLAAAYKEEESSKVAG